jgi:hypothetical protein
MSAPADSVSRNRSAVRTASVVTVWSKKFTVWLKKIFAQFYIALDEAQRKRAAEIIKRYGHLIPDRDEDSREQK